MNKIELEKGAIVQGKTFSPDCELGDRTLSNVSFEDCLFDRTGMLSEITIGSNVVFINCAFRCMSFYKLNLTTDMTFKKCNFLNCNFSELRGERVGKKNAAASVQLGFFSCIMDSVRIFSKSEHMLIDIEKCITRSLIVRNGKLSKLNISDSILEQTEVANVDCTSFYMKNCNLNEFLFDHMNVKSSLTIATSMLVGGRFRDVKADTSLFRWDSLANLNFLLCRLGRCSMTSSTVTDCNFEIHEMDNFIRPVRYYFEKGKVYKKAIGPLLANRGYTFTVGLNEVECFVTDIGKSCAFPALHFGTPDYVTMYDNTAEYVADIIVPEDAKINNTISNCFKASADKIIITKIVDAGGKDVTDEFRGWADGKGNKIKKSGGSNVKTI